MVGKPARSQWVVVALFEPMAPGTSFSRREWPAHVTLASPFTVDASGEELAAAVGSAVTETWPLPIRFGGPAMFGRRHDVAVQLVESASVVGLHERLADVLEALPGFAARDPRHWRDGYRPHMTHVASVDALEGQARKLPSAALAELVGGTATVTASFDGA